MESQIVIRDIEGAIGLGGALSWRAELQLSSGIWLWRNAWRLSIYLPVIDENLDFHVPGGIVNGQQHAGRVKYFDIIYLISPSVNIGWCVLSV